jgi:GcrA cell cycle regulator
VTPAADEDKGEAMPKRPDLWNDERIAILKQLWAEGKTAGAIGKKLGGFSRSAVLGKIFRLRLRTDKASAETATPKADCQKPQPAVRKNGPVRRRSGPVQSGAAKPPRTSTHKSLLELTNTCCRWPHGRPGAKNFFFCGAPGADVENGIPYCASHMQRAYVVAPADTVTPWRVESLRAAPRAA